ncbi:hypothetical protein O181_061892 [Austropuccinia psidii MF-1]|uniref:Uncharacterized protein n=1 Tax=Austropuccinia psidii MF-1 TaxID=1389203 RepID=A0A9Q3HZV2_9BASI|nr:hypothetical protein [Austropuccinia psidii MF-1]
MARWTNVGGPILTGGRPIYSSSEVPIFRINTEGIVKRIRQISNSPLDPDAEPPAKRFQIKIITSNPRNFQPTLDDIPTSIPPASPHQACLESSSKAIPHKTAQNLTHSHLTTTPTCGQYQ